MKKATLAAGCLGGLLLVETETDIPPGRSVRSGKWIELVVVSPILSSQEPWPASW
jgi:hypothetical protein